MNQQPITVTYSLEEILTRLEQKIDSRFEEMDRRFEQLENKMENRFEEIERRFEKLENKMDNLQKDTSDIKVKLATLTQKVEGIDDRLKVVEGTQKNQVWTLIILLIGAIATASAKLFGIIGNP